MALYDNKYWLLSHIRNSFISTDDTGMCEIVMTGESKQFKQHLLTLEQYPDSEDSEDDDEMESYDLQIDFGMRERPNTLFNRLEKSDQMKKKSTKMRHIKWETRKTAIPQEQLDDLFVKKDLSKLPETIQPHKSALTQIIEKFTNLPINPYTEYSKFDGSGQVIPTRKYRIFMTMLPEEQRNYPLNICCVGSAKVQDLIGLILLKSSSTYSEHQFKSISNYGLYITEEDGEVDRDFPSLDAREPVSKFGFTCLGLVELKDPKNVTFENCETITIAGPIEYFNKTRHSSRIESKVDENKQIKNDLELIQDHNKKMEAPLYQSYRVYIIHKVRARIEIHLGISGEKIEIDPVQQKSSTFNLVKQKAVSHPMDTVACCEITDIKSNRTTFKIVYSSSISEASVSSSFPIPLHTSASFKHYDFEADNTTAIEIVQKINMILDLQTSTSRKEYLAARERKQYKNKSFLK